VGQVKIKSTYRHPRARIRHNKTACVSELGYEMAGIGLVSTWSAVCGYTSAYVHGSVNPGKMTP